MNLWRASRLLASTPFKVNTLLIGLTEEHLRWKPSADDWSIKEVLCHLRDTAELHGERMRRVATEENPTLPAWDEQAAARDKHYQDEVTDSILPAYVAHRSAVVELLSGLDTAALDRPGTHSEAGPLTLGTIVEGTIDHDQNHLDQLRRLKAAVLRALP